MNQADGELIPIQWECTEFELVKGHVDAGAARNEAAHHLGIDVEEWRVEHVWCRYVPDGDEYSMRLHDANPEARGAFRATRVYVYAASEQSWWHKENASVNAMRAALDQCTKNLRANQARDCDRWRDCGYEPPPRGEKLRGWCVRHNPNDARIEQSEKMVMYDGKWSGVHEHLDDWVVVEHWRPEAQGPGGEDE